jgi:diaminopimelate epimerase
MNVLIPFEKMHGLGNDFVIIDAGHLNESEANLPQEQRLYERELAKKISNRHEGIGADGLIIIDSVKNSSEAIKSWRYYNSDGSVSEMCGNGIRCAAKYIYEHGLSGEDESFKIETLAGDISVAMLPGEEVCVNMGAPKSIKLNQSLVLKEDPGFKFDYDAISMGNPHAVAFFNNLDGKQLEAISLKGPLIEVHSDFPNKSNVEFARLLKSSIELIVWERGCGFTRACGTGACATVVSAISRGYFSKDEEIQVKLPGGILKITWDSVTDSILMTGPAEIAFVGYYHEKIF